MSDSKQSANEELQNALRLCMEQMCARCREAADALTASIPCLTGCETLKIAKAALDRKPMNCEALSKEEALAELAKRLEFDIRMIEFGNVAQLKRFRKAQRIVAELAKVEDRHNGETNSDVLWRCNDCIAKCRAIAEEGANNGK